MKKLGFFTMVLALIIIGCNGNDDNDIIEGSGTIEATNIVISAKVAGSVKNIIKDEGSLVSVGDTILAIEHELLDLQLKKAVAMRDAAEAQLQLSIKGARPEDRAQANELLKQAEANYNLALADRDRMESLYKSQTITKKQWDDIQTRFTVAESQYTAAKENNKKIKNIARPEEKKQAQANYDNANASVMMIEKNIRDCYVTASSKGYIVKMFFEEGESVMPGSSLFKLSDLSVVDLVIYVPETKLGLLKIGQSAEVEIDAFEEKSFDGKVTYISPEAEFTPKNIQTKDERTKLVFAVKIEIPNSNFELKAGLPADGKIIVK